MTAIFDDIDLLRGSIKIGLGLLINRNMMIMLQDDELTLVNAVRISALELEKLDRLEKVKSLIRLGDFDGLNDWFYLDRYQAIFWSHVCHKSYPELIPQPLIQAEQRYPIKMRSFLSLSKPLVQKQLYLYQISNY